MALTYYVYRTPLGRITLQSDGSALVRLAFGAQELAGARCASELTNRASTEVLEYLSCHRKHFDVPLRVSGSEFQQAVWEAIAQIPYGEVRTYAQIAALIGHPRATRAVGSACGRNALPLLIPCHRVVGAHGKLCGYSAGPSVEDPLRIKRYLLDLESGVQAPVRA